MLYAWTDAGDDPDFNLGNIYGINGYFWPLWDALTTHDNLMDTKARGYAVGVYVGAGWHDDWSPARYATRVHEEMARLNVPGLRVMFNLEEHNPERIARILEEWRSMKARRYTSTSWSPEGMQGGWMSPGFVERVMRCRVRVVPQCFTGDMKRRAEDVIKWDVVRRGFPENVVSVFYDGKYLPMNADGYVFTMGRLAQHESYSFFKRGAQSPTDFPGAGRETC